VLPAVIFTCLRDDKVASPSLISMRARCSAAKWNPAAIRSRFFAQSTPPPPPPRPATEHSYTQIADGLRQHGSQAAANIEQLWRRIAFSILITNVDDHLQNHGLLHVGCGQFGWRPPWTSTPSRSGSGIEDLDLRRDGPAATIDALMSVISYFRIPRDRALAILAVAAWREEGLALGMTNQELDSFADAFEHKKHRAMQTGA
jgi:serine/threonine-protein kinase HipA